MSQILPSTNAIELAKKVLRIEAAAILALTERLDTSFVDALTLILNSHGRVIVCGIGKSGHIGRKIASTLASTGTPAFFVHPAEASHGDLGMITPDDIVIGISNSGESAELLNILPSIKRQGAKLIAMTGKPNSTLAQFSDVCLNTAVAQEACPLNLAPTASTTAVLAMGDALAVTLLDARGFGADDFARSHPGGSLGRKLLTRLSDVMRTGDDVPTISPNATIADASKEISRCGIGMAVVIDEAHKVVGIITDGDLRRAIALGRDLTVLSVTEVMTQSPKLMRGGKLAAEAVELMERYKINQIPVTDDHGVLLGAINMHDLFRAKAI